MRQKYALVGAGLLCLGLAGYLAFAGGQGPDGQPTPTRGPRDYSLVLDEPPLPPTAGPSQPAAATPPGLVPFPSRPIEPPSRPIPGTTPIEGLSPALPPPAATSPTLLPGAMVPATQGQPVSTPTPPAEDAAPENPAGKQEPAVSIEWVGSPTAKVGQMADYGLLVRNTSSATVHQVTVRIRVPAGLQVHGTEPRASNDGGSLTWEVGTLAAKQERTLQMKVQATTKGDLVPTATVSLSGMSSLRIKVREPKLALKASAPEKVLVGDAVAFTLTVSNPGDGAAEQVKVQALLSEGLEHARGNKIDFDVGNLGPGESRSVQLICASRNGGAQRCDGLATSEGALRATDTASVNIIKPHLDVAISGPGLRYLERKAIYTLKVSNPGDAPATNVTVSHIVPVGFKVLAASDGGRHDYSTRTVSWFVGEVGPAQAREVKLEVQAVNPGDHRHKVVAIGARGLRAEGEFGTKVEGLSAILVEMVDTDDPIEVGAETAYEIRVTNTGSQTENDIKLLATIPEKMEFRSAQGPVRHRLEGKTVIFEPLEKLAPRADAIMRVIVRGTEPGIVRFKMQVTSANLIEPVIKMEATRVYADAPESSGTVPGRLQPPLQPATGQPGGPAAPAFPAPPGGTSLPVPPLVPGLPSPDQP